MRRPIRALVAVAVAGIAGAGLVLEKRRGRRMRGGSGGNAIVVVKPAAPAQAAPEQAEADSQPEPLLSPMNFTLSHFSMLVILLKVEPGTVAGVHKHFGAAHAYILEGGFGYEHGEVFAGDYMVEAGGITHQPFTGPKGLILLGFMFGPIGGFDEAGNLAGVLDIEWHYQAALANGAAGHIQRKPKEAAQAH